MAKMVVIDPGHGGHDPGASEGDLVEKNMALKLAKQIAALLADQYEVDVRMTRDTDIFIPLSERANIADRLGADYFVSVHHNRAGGSGFESFVYPGTQNGVTGQMQRTIHDQIMSYMRGYGVRDRGKKTANFAVLRETSMPAILLEYLFVDQPDDARLLRNDTFMYGVAQATATGIAKAMNLPGQTRSVEQPNPQQNQTNSNWKTDAVDWLFQKGILTDGSWRQNVDEPVPLWAVAVMLRRMYDQLNK